LGRSRPLGLGEEAALRAELEGWYFGDCGALAATGAWSARGVGGELCAALTARGVRLRASGATLPPAALEVRLVEHPVDQRVLRLDGEWVLAGPPQLPVRVEPRGPSRSDVMARLARQEGNRRQEELRRQAARLWRPFAGSETANANAIAIAIAIGSATDDAASDGEEAAAIPGDQAGLEALQGRLAAVVQAGERELHQASAALSAARAHQQEQERLAERWDRRQQAAARLEERLSHQAKVEEVRQRLQQAEQAEALRAGAMAEQQASQTLIALESGLQGELEQCRQLLRRAQGLPPALQQLDLRSLAEAQTLGDLRSDLASRRAELKALAAQQHEAQLARQRAEAAASQAEASAVRQRQALTEQTTLHQHLAPLRPLDLGGPRLLLDLGDAGLGRRGPALGVRAPRAHGRHLGALVRLRLGGPRRGLLPGRHE
jgi:hypothetical protein